MSHTIEVDTKTFVRFWLVIAALAVIALFLWRARIGLMIVALSIFLAVSIQPLANWIGKINRKKKRPALAATIAVIAVVAVVGFILAVIGPVVVHETIKFISQAPDTFENTLGGWSGINQFGRNFGIDNLEGEINNGIEEFSKTILADFSGVVVSGVGFLANLLAGAVLVVVLTLLFLLQGPTLLDALWKKISGKNNKTAKVVQRIAGEIAGVISKYMTGQVAVAVLDGIVSGLAVFTLALVFGFSPGLAFPMGLITATFYLIPMFGAVISCVLVSLLLFFSSPAAGIAFAIFYIIYQQIENNIIAPKIQGNVLKLPSLIILVSITVGMYMFGLIGAIISIPIAGCIKVFIDEYPNIKALKS